MAGKASDSMLQSMAPLWFEHAIASPTTSHRVSVAGAEVHFRCWNEEERNKPPLLFVHGFLANSHWWDFIAPFLTDWFRVFAMDFSGMGESGHRAAYATELWREEIDAVVQAAGGGPAIVVAHSFGGARAVEACAAHPADFAQLVVVDSYIHFADNPPRMGRFQPPVQPRRYSDLASAMSRYRLIPDQPAPDWILAHLGRHSLRQEEGGWGWKFDQRNLTAPRDEPDSTAVLAGVTVPTSLVFGARSHIATRHRMERVAELLPDCRGVIEIPEAKHHVMLDQPLAMVACLRTLLCMHEVSTVAG